MKILQINKYGYRKGGSETHFFDLIDSLEGRGHEVPVFTASRDDNAALPGEVDFSKPGLGDILKMFWNFEAARKLSAMLEKERPDIAHLHNIYHHLSPSIIHVLKKKKIPIVMTLHDCKIICPNYKLFNSNGICEKCKGDRYYQCLANKCIKESRTKSFLAMLEAYLHRSILKSYEKVDLFIAPSEFMRNKFIEFGMPAGKIMTVYNFVNMDKGFLPGFVQADPPKGQSMELRSGNTEYLLYFGRLSKEKGVDVLIEAMGMVDDRLKLKIVGDGPELQNLIIKIRSMGLERRIELPGWKSEGELAILIEQSKAVVLPSVWYENMPLSMLESMSMGKVVIASCLGGMAEVIEDGIDGFLFKTGDPCSLAEKINGLEDLNLLKIKENAYIKSKKFKKDIFLEKLENIYLDVIMANIK